MSDKCQRLKKDLKTPCRQNATRQGDVKWKVPHCQFHEFFPPVGTENPHLNQCGVTTTRGEPCKWAVAEKGDACSFHREPVVVSVTKSVAEPKTVVEPVKSGVVVAVADVVVVEPAVEPVVVEAVKAIKSVGRCGGVCSSKASTCRRIVNKVGDRCSLHLNQLPAK